METTKRNFVYENQLQNASRRLIPLVVIPLTVSACLTCLWYGLQLSEIYLVRSEALIGHMLEVMGILYSIFAGTMITVVVSDYKAMSRAVVTKDKREFLIYRDEEISRTFHQVFFMIGLTIQILVIANVYENFWTGIFCVSITAGFLTSVTMLIRDFDDPHKSVWFQKKVPKDWWTENVDEFMEKYKAENGKKELS